ncbi:hypothetical protein C8A00DRAFT_16657 [Chaetomidium leptoderma]|uniref:gamma-glutamylcyclotransferase n=1 Tax=Chaetomidium leptoderma TaxID=669021 RepID=A0AAN6ZX23_9PEZI|nr:hypothetical protein C8A00DRAFT_16657 [Chaetomidium leptoderma]
MSPRAPRLYFAYGSNLSLTQMATRCPGSYYIGRAVLPDHRWQINQRGYANVVACPGFTVHGLVYELNNGDGNDNNNNNDDDETRLDRSEGVHSGAYTKALLSVVLYPAPAAAQRRTRVVAKEGLLFNGSGSGGADGGERRRTASLQERVLVYLSEQFVRPGLPRDEYVDRMNRGIRDAVMMGVPEAYFENVVRASIPDRPPPPPPPSRAQSVGRTRERPRPRSVSVSVEEERDPPGVVWGREDPRRRSWTPNVLGWQYSGYVGGGRQVEDRGLYRIYHAERPY